MHTKVLGPAAAAPGRRRCLPALRPGRRAATRVPCTRPGWCRWELPSSRCSCYGSAGGAVAADRVLDSSHREHRDHRAHNVAGRRHCGRCGFRGQGPAPADPLLRLRRAPAADRRGRGAGAANGARPGADGGGHAAEHVSARLRRRRAAGGAAAGRRKRLARLHGRVRDTCGAAGLSLTGRGVSTGAGAAACAVSHAWESEVRRKSRHPSSGGVQCPLSRVVGKGCPSSRRRSSALPLTRAHGEEA
mmetsp:Transcript_9665/g.28521  ORF Transcript_9665/g.28521 Transcript_9665/m.28521 type:complete len:246 (+) Transcript_9665:245-982(+)